MSVNPKTKPVAKKSLPPKTSPAVKRGVTKKKPLSAQVRISLKPEAKRVAALRKLMEKHDVPALLLQSAANRRYFSGFTAADSQINESSGCLLITQEDSFLLTDSRFELSAKLEALTFETHIYREGPHVTLQTIFNGKRLFFEPEFMTYRLLANLRATLPNVNFLPLPFSPAELRIIKTNNELHLIQKAVEITEKSLGLLWNELEPGIPEEWIARFLDDHFRKFGAEGSAFPSIVAAGPNAALPHAEPGKKKVGKSEMVVIDIGARFNGYASDMTRTFMPKKPMGWQKEIYMVVREAQLRALSVLKAGVTGSEVDLAARDFIRKKGYGDYFQHQLGHGVGLEVHESPHLGPRHNKVPLPAGALVTVEPGIYLPGKGGVRLEELVLITETGNSILNKDSHFYEF
ncbi:MAG: aminopeptidase P family protein [Deltaproteobacteria bacterium]|jgi:Xaa-Pro aminopeptidase|nr:aminopeptidase P family protein [Deltaproteobacteria bacterium]